MDNGGTSCFETYSLLSFDRGRKLHVGVDVIDARSTDFVHITLHETST